MPIRIYALAKELKLDSKELVEVCNKAGITGKGSALASLDDDEVTRVKAFLSGTSGAKGPAKAAGGEPAPASSAPSSTPEPATYTRDEYIPATAPTPGKIKMLGGKSKSSRSGDAAEKSKSAKARTPVIHVAQLPEVEQPTAPPKAEEPAPQKPDIRLPQDAIASAKQGTRPPLEHLTAKAEKKKKDKQAEKDKGKDKEKDRTRSPDFDVIDDEASRPLKGRGKRIKEKSDVDRTLAGMASARADRQKARSQRIRPGILERDEETGRTYRRRAPKRKGLSTAAPRKGKITLSLPCTVRSFSEATGVSSSQVIGTLMKLGVMLNINAQIDPDMVELLAAELGVDIDIRAAESIEDTVLKSIREQQDDEASLVPRPPIVTFLGHVDHGKTSLLDYLIGTNVVAGEAGGITQHIRAFQVEAKDGRKVSFVDTPGHAAFTEMRARGANVTDIAVLVVAADDGIMPQTEEAISHAKAAGVPIVVALNKMDLPGANPNRVLTQLTEHQLTPSEWGGDVEVVRTSAITGQGMEELLDTLLTIAELNDYRANPNRPAYGVCLEAEQEGSRGVVAKLVVQNGTLRAGDVVVCGSAHGRIKALYDTLHIHERLKEAGPSRPVNVTGFDRPPEAGEAFYVLDDIAVAREIAERRESQARAASLAGNTTRISFERFQSMLKDGRLGETKEAVTLNLIIRADTRGSVEAIVKELDKLEHPEVRIKVLLKGVGGITTGDVHLAEASDAVIIGFNVTPDEAARQLAEEKAVEIRRYDIIYKLTDDLKATLEGKLKPEERVIDLGRAVVKQVFTISRVGAVAGCYVVQGNIERGCRIRVFREGRLIGEYPLESLRREKDDVREVQRGMECGLKLANFNDIKKDDILEAYKIEEVARTL